MAIPARAYLINKHSGLAIDIEGANPNEYARVVQWNLTGNANQRFELKPIAITKGGGFWLSAEHSGGKVVSAHPSFPDRVTQYNLYEPDKAMRFNFQEYGGSDFGEGLFWIVSQYPPNKVLTVKDASTTPGTQLVQADLRKGDASQLWELRAVS
ncbi:RICIN domain-containing protein [Nonomuraea sp. NBC_01738]|uniref:RICIN domain-containing protein n=1 Tax=Nonomuraea sp. NBC_01738 TaxID=2976003 RepID=UPI002E0E32ED|nr:RICIN domain-containing protein [Nonomuraea sp. NBC_01738]